jgi:hypothetical protein
MDEKKDKRSIIFALFGPQCTLPPILETLRIAGVPDKHVEVLSALPLSGVPLHKPVALRLYPIAIIAGVIGIGVGIFFAGGTAALYPVMTGGKAIVAIPVVGIISYETMMLVAIVTTFISMAIKIVFTDRSGIGHDPRIDEGAIGISVRLDPGDNRCAVIEGLLRQAGAQEVETR